MKPLNNQPFFKAIIIMGVSGCGKTTIADKLAEQLGWTFIESDNYHSEAHIHKMASGIPLMDADRLPWLERLHDLLIEFSQKNQPSVLACSALKEKYRQTLTAGLRNIRFVYLKGDYELIWQRMQERQHYMQPSMLKSQFEALEEPEDALVIDISHSPEKIVSEILRQI
jgi:carbohydrate kinase (thermoresistant glucokinase family)